MPEVSVRERPILFTGPMVRALLAGTKTQTRRVVACPFKLWRRKVYDAANWTVQRHSGGGWRAFQSPVPLPPPEFSPSGFPCPYGAPGDRLWVREAWNAELDWPDEPGQSRVRWSQDVPLAFRGPRNAMSVYFRADRSEYEVWEEDAHVDGNLVRSGTLSAARFDAIRWRPSIHMPRWASRLTLEVADVRVERLHDLSDADAAAEGRNLVPGHADYFPDTWDRLNAARGYGWDANPWVWVLTFRRAEAPHA